MDRNRLTNIENLQNCSSLRVLNLSYNQITTLDGLSGLQSLVELKINNNAVKSLRPLKGLPSLREIDCSYNNLKSLDGIQFLSIVEVVRAEHNQIYSLKLGADFDHIEELSLKKSASSDGGPASAKANRLNEMTNALKEARKGSNSNFSASSAKGKNIKAKTAEDKQLNITELHIRGNRLKNLDGLVSLGPNIEVLDISNNDITADADSLCRQIGHLFKLTEIRIEGNPSLMALSTVDNESMVELLQNAIVNACPSLQNMDMCAVVGGRVVNSQNNRIDTTSAGDEASLRLIKDIETTLNIDNNSCGPGSKPVLNADGTISHTWVDRGENSTVLDENGFVEQCGPIYSSDEDREEQRGGDDIAQVKTTGLNIDESMLSEAQIAEIESTFTSLLHQCRERLNALPRPPTRGEDEDGVSAGQLSSVYTDLGGRSIGMQSVVTDQGRRTSKNLASHGAEARALHDGMLSPPMPPIPNSPIAKSLKRQVASEISVKTAITGNEMPILTTASSLVTNVIMYTSPAGELNGNELQRTSSLKDVNVDAFSRKDGLADAI